MTNIQKEKVILVDAFNLFYRNLSTHPSVDFNGEPNGGYIGFINQLKGFIEEFNPQYCFVVFDGGDAGFRRRQIFKDYKGKKARKKRYSYLKFDEEFTEAVDNEDEQIALIFETLQQLPVIVFQIDYYEADDIIAHLVNTLQGTENIICSSDQDYIQLVSDNTFIYSPTKKILLNKENIKEHYGILKENFLYYRTVIGDPSDKITGIDGVGAKTVIKLIPELSNKVIENLDEFLLLINNIEGSGAKISSLKSGSDLIVRNHKLSQLNSINLSLKAIDSVNLHLEKQKDKGFSVIKLKLFFIKRGINHHIKNYEKWIRPFLFLKTKIDKIWN